MVDFVNATFEAITAASMQYNVTGDTFVGNGLFKPLLLYQKITAYIIIVMIVCGLFLNGLVLYIVIRHRDMHKVTNFFFANLALTDFLLLTLHAVTSSVELLGFNLAIHVGCTTVQYTRYVISQVTCLTLALMSIDRYRMVVHPMSSLDKQRRLRLMLVAILVTWIASFVLHLPVAVFSVNPYGITCSIVFPWEYGPKVFFTYTMIVLYILPLVVATTCYALIWLRLRKTPDALTEDAGKNRARARRMQRTTRIMVLVVVMFALGWFCEHLFIMLIVWDPNINFWSVSYRIGSATAKLTLYLNSMLNPFVYPLAGTGFKKHLPSWPCKACIYNKEYSHDSGTGAALKTQADAASNLHARENLHVVRSDATLQPPKPLLDRNNHHRNGENIPDRSPGWEQDTWL